ncbi:uncharacterized protein LOC124267127 [Haliotis rubra]|uniref:uncharacterized protein LOC124267127 n=1 Tax=Haliotis rubra TaxID=36100 RepID=UPI001EE59307|nr:uncharacterized protein LOC124267127 [Haliotis rubra]
MDGEKLEIEPWDYLECYISKPVLGTCEQVEIPCRRKDEDAVWVVYAAIVLKKLLTSSCLLGLSVAFTCIESDGHFQHETRCDLYYWCVGGVAHVTHCPPGSFFSTITNFCNWPYAVSGCSDDGARTDVGGGGWSQPQPQPQPQPPRQPPQHLNSWEQDNHRWNDQGWDSYMAKALTGVLSKVKSSGRQKREADVKGFQCPSSHGYYRHPTTCNEYIWCVNSVPRLQACLGDNLFNYDIKRCDQRNKVFGCDGNQRTDQGFQCPSSTGYYRHPTTCNEYIWCVDSVPHLQACLGDNLFNYDIKRCDQRNKVFGCDGNQRTDQGYQCPTSYGYFRHPTSCREYIWCIGSVPNRMECEGENLFDYNIRRCNKPWVVKDCDNSARRINPERTPFKSSTRLSRTKRSIFQGFQCPNSYGYFRHPTSCRQYVWCVDGIPRLMECNGGSVFDISIKRCNFPSQVKGCSGGERRTDPEGTPFTHLGLHPVEEPEYTCEGEEDGLWGHPKNCSIYYHCNRGKGTRFTCSPGTFFNPSTLVCSWPGEVHDCAKDGTVKEFFFRKRRSAYLKRETKDNHRPHGKDDELPFLIPEETYPCPITDGYYPHKTNCSVYFRCTQGKSTRFTCNPGTFYHARIFGCSWPDHVLECDSEGNRKERVKRKRRSIFSEPGQKEAPLRGFRCPFMDGYYRHPTDCTSYFWCVNRKSTKYSCANGTFFNPKMKLCTWPAQVTDCDMDGVRISHSPYQSST